MKITRVHRAVAEALITQRLSADEVKARFKVAPQRLAEWQEDPAFVNLLRDVEARFRRRARWLFLAFAETAAARLIKLLDSETEETVRKTSIDVLEHACLGAGSSDGDASVSPLIEVPAETRLQIYRLMTAAAAPSASLLLAARPLSLPGPMDIETVLASEIAGEKAGVPAPEDAD